MIAGCERGVQQAAADAPGTDYGAEGNDTVAAEGEVNETIDEDAEAADTGAEANQHTITITAEGFSPSNLTINEGDTVIWANEDKAEHWPASAMHPTHTAYPGSNIEKCGTQEEINIFDACMGLDQGQRWAFRFSEKGEWAYHDHLNPRAPFFGTVIVR